MKLNYRRAENYLFMGIILFVIVACGRSGDVVSPTAEEQIKNVALSYFVRDSAVPTYEANVEEVVDNWARVTLTPVGTDVNEPLTVYLQNQAESDNPVPTAAPDANPGNIARTESDLGWAIITPPQAHFTPEELNAMAVPAKIRPQ